MREEKRKGGGGVINFTFRKKDIQQGYFRLLQEQIVMLKHDVQSLNALFSLT